MNDFQARVLECALYYRTRGWKVLPLHTILGGRCTCGRADCTSPGKHPATISGVKDASNDEDVIGGWFGGGHSYNIGIASGKETGLVVLDVDPRHGGHESLRNYRLPNTLEVITGSGGRHYYFFYPEGANIRNSAGKLGAGLDIRGDGGYVVAPPSVHACGSEYRWAIDPRAASLAECPEFILKIRNQNEKKMLNPPAADGETIPEGRRNATLASIAGAMRRKGCEPEAIYAALIQTNKHRCKPPLEFEELKDIALSMGRYPPEDESHILEDDLPEILAQAFEDSNTAKHRFNCIDGWSLLKNNRYTPIKNESEIEAQLRQYLTTIRIRKQVNGSWVKVRFRRTNSKIQDIMKELASLKTIRIPAEQNAPSSLDGTLNPRTIISLDNMLIDISQNPPRAIPLTEQFYTLHYLPYAYDPNATCEKWLAFLGSIFTKRKPTGETRWNPDTDRFDEVFEQVPDEQAVSILQEWFGYLVTTDTHLHKIFALIGEKRSGKSTIGKVLQALVGVENTASPNLPGLSGEFGLQGLMGKTLVILSDANATNKGGSIGPAVQRLKSISGEDPQRINLKNKTPVDSAKLTVRFMVIANTMQDLRDNSGALASRFTILITTQSFYGREDTKLEHKLMAELPGIFNWALEGLERLRKRGRFEEHPAGLELREDFDDMSSPMRAFVKDWCVIEDNLFIPVDILWKAHNNWAAENGNRAYSKRKFIIEIKGACSRIKRERRRLDLSHLSHCYNWDNGDSDNRVAVLAGIALRKEYQNQWDNRDSGTGSGTGYLIE